MNITSFHNVFWCLCAHARTTSRTAQNASTDDCVNNTADIGDIPASEVRQLEQLVSVARSQEAQRIEQLFIEGYQIAASGRADYQSNHTGK